MFDKPVPHVDNILWLTRLSMPFPTTAGNIVEVAESWRFSSNTLNFLKLFPQDKIFSSREDFISCSQELELQLREKATVSQAAMLSPQD